MAKADCGREGLDGEPSELDAVEAALHRLTQMVAADSERLESLDEKLDAIMEHLGVPLTSSHLVKLRTLDT